MGSEITTTSSATQAVVGRLAAKYQKYVCRGYIRGCYNPLPSNPEPAVPPFRVVTPLDGPAENASGPPSP